MPLVSLQTLLKLDKFLLTCLITFAFTTIPYYSCDYLFNQFIGITPKDEILNNHNLRVNYTDYSSLLGIQLPDKSSIFNTDVSLYDRAHFMYGEWPTSFESLNYQGELFWTNLRDHRRQKRTRRSTRIKFKNLKSKIATSWKTFKRNDSLSLEKKTDNFSDSSTLLPDRTRNELGKHTNNSLLDQKTNQIYSGNLSTLKTQDLLINNRLKNDQNIFSKLFGVSPLSNFGVNIEANSNTSSSLNSENPFNIQNRRESLSETIKNLSAVSFKDLSGNTKSFTNYPKNWKKVITEKYYQNQIYKILLSSDLKNFLKREPLTQQLASTQEKELDFLRMKMCHYFDTLRFYFKMKEKIKPYSDPIQNNIPQGQIFGSPPFQKSNPSRNKIGDFGSPPVVSTKQPEEQKGPVSSSQNQSIASFSQEPRSEIGTRGAKNLQELDSNKKPSNINTERSSMQIGLRNLPFQFKSMMSLNYHQRFKGSLKPVRELFQIASPNSISESFPTETHQIVDGSPRFDKSLFNEFPINQNSFFHEELSKKSRPMASQGLDLSASSRTTRGAEPQISNLFGSNDPFYVGWDKNLRKFILTSRFLSRPGSLNEQV